MTELFGMHYSKREIERHVGRLDQIGGITPVVLSQGRAQGVRALRLATGSGFAVTALADRNLDLAHAEYHGMSLCWRSVNGDVAPAYYEPEGEGFLYSFFGGLMTTAGLTNIGPGGTDQWGEIGLHGRINSLPAEDVAWSETWNGDECTLEITGTTRETRVFGVDFSLHRRLTTRLGSSSLLLEDTVTNHGDTRWPHMILYHCNGGFPLLMEGTRLHVSHADMHPRDAEAEKGVDVWNVASAPQPGFKEQVFIHTPIACRDGRAAVVLINDRLNGGNGLGLAIRFDPTELPALIQWRMMGERTYVMGMEPANCPTIQGRVEAEKRGTLPILEPGQSRHYAVEFQVLDGPAAIDEMVRLIDEANG